MVMLAINSLSVILNSFTFYVLLNHRPVTSYVYLLGVLARADTGVAIISILNSFRKSYIDWIPLALILKLMRNFFVYFSNWTLVVVTIDRFNTLCRPLHSRRICTINRARHRVAIVILMCSVFSSVHVLMLVFRVNFLVELLFQVRIVLMCGPCVIVLIINIFIIRELLRSQRRHARLTGRHVTSFCQQNGLVINLLITNIVFVACVIPHSVIFIIWQNKGDLVWLTSIESPLTSAFINESFYLQSFNSLVNCFIYVVFFKTFRKTITTIFKKV